MWDRRRNQDSNFTERGSEIAGFQYVESTMDEGRKGTRMKVMIRKFIGDESGATAIEYGLIAAGISVAIIAVVQSLGTALNTTFTSVATALK